MRWCSPRQRRRHRGPGRGRLRPLPDPAPRRQGLDRDHGRAGNRTVLVKYTGPARRSGVSERVLSGHPIGGGSRFYGQARRDYRTVAQKIRPAGISCWHRGRCRPRPPTGERRKSLRLHDSVAFGRQCTAGPRQASGGAFLRDGVKSAQHAPSTPPGPCDTVRGTHRPTSRCAGGLMNKTRPDAVSSPVSVLEP